MRASLAYIRVDKETPFANTYVKQLDIFNDGFIKTFHELFNVKRIMDLVYFKLTSCS